MRASAIAGMAVLIATTGGALGASYIASNDPLVQFRQHLLAPPMPVRMLDATGALHRPFVYPLRVVDRLERQFIEDRSRPVPIRLFHRGRILALETDAYGPWLPLGADHLGRDVFARAVHGARISLAVAGAAVAGALLLGAVLGAIAGYSRGWIDDGLMRVAEFVLVLPVLYVVMAVRATLPATIDPWQVFTLMVLSLVVLGWPSVARGVRGIISTEASRDYAAAARALGARPSRIVALHLAPATFDFLRAQALILVPAAIVAESTLSFAGLGFGSDRPSWGTLLRDASDVRALADHPWLLVPAFAIAVVVLAVNLVTTTARPRDAWHRAEVGL